jgi:putative ABC transport system permease protein
VIVQSIKIAWKAIAMNKMRSFLTMLGIIIGVLSLVVLVSLVTSATRSVTEEIESMGNDMLTVYIFNDGGRPLKLQDLEDFVDAEESIASAAPATQISGMVKSGRNEIDASMLGVNNAYFGISGSVLASGRYLTAPDLDNASNVAVVSNELATSLFGDADVRGRTLSMGGRKFTVVGVLAPTDSMGMGMMSNYNAFYIPFTAAMRISSPEVAVNGSGVTTFYATAVDADSTAAAEDAIRKMCTERFGGEVFEDGGAENFYIASMDVMAESMGAVMNIFAVLLGGIAAISLLVGGIGIMNIMLVSVTERTREIGIRKAIGAKGSSIMLQFLIEALVLCLIGCFIGILISAGIIALINAAVTQMTFSVSGGVILVAVIFSTVIGLIFGIYPARKAARKNPIDALRFE